MKRRRIKWRKQWVGPRLSVKQILAWADALYERKGHWPTLKSGVVYEDNNETWSRLNYALKYGSRGLNGGSSIAKLLLDRRGVRQGVRLMKEGEILRWADMHRQRTGLWPKSNSGPVLDAPGQSWQIINGSLIKGRRGLPGGTSLAELLAQHRDVPHVLGRLLSVPQILSWADKHHEQTGRWPQVNSGPILDARDTWRAIDSALIWGVRGLVGGSSLARLLEEHRGARNKNYPPQLTAKQILAWADAHRRNIGEWPISRSGAIADVPGETWSTVDHALRCRTRGLRRGGSLSQFLAKHGRVGAIRNSRR